MVSHATRRPPASEEDLSVDLRKSEPRQKKNQAEDEACYGDD